MKQNDLSKIEANIIPAGTTVYRFMNNKLEKAEVENVEINLRTDCLIDVCYTLHYLSGGWARTCLNHNEMMKTCSLTQEECVKQFLESIGVKAKISIEFE